MGIVFEPGEAVGLGVAEGAGLVGILQAEAANPRPSRQTIALRTIRFF